MFEIITGFGGKVLGSCWLSPIEKFDSNGRNWRWCFFFYFGFDILVDHRSTRCFNRLIVRNECWSLVSSETLWPHVYVVQLLRRLSNKTASPSLSFSGLVLLFRLLIKFSNNYFQNTNEQTNIKSSGETITLFWATW